MHSFTWDIAIISNISKLSPYALPHSYLVNEWSQESVKSLFGDEGGGGGWAGWTVEEDLVQTAEEVSEEYVCLVCHKWVVLKHWTLCGRG